MHLKVNSDQLIEELNSSDWSLLNDQQLYDPSLNNIHQQAEKQQWGYAYVDGLLIHADQSSANIQVCQIILPQSCETPCAAPSSWQWP